MAKILAFRASRYETIKVRHRNGSSAEIVIFPGVRYEHWTEPQPKNAEAKPKKSLRDVLKLVD